MAIVLALSHWQKDSNQSCFHDKAAQDKLPAAEQKAFTQLCAAVVAMLKKTEEKLKEPPSAVERGEGAGLLGELAMLLEKELR